jgi:hypothetical protein
VAIFTWRIVPVDADGNEVMDRQMYTEPYGIKNTGDTSSSTVPANLPDVPTFSYLEDNYQNQHHVYHSNISILSQSNGPLNRYATAAYDRMLANGQGVLINDMTPTLHGAATPGTSVKIYCVGYAGDENGKMGMGSEGMVLRGEAAVDGNGNWSFTDDVSSFIPKGLVAIFTWRIVPVDADGNEVMDRQMYTEPYGIKNVAETINQTHFIGDEHSTLLDGSTHDMSLIQNATIHLQDSVDAAESKQVLTLEDILSHAQQDMFILDGHQQLAVTGDAGDTVELRVSDLSAHEWTDAGQTTAGGVTYEVYQHAGSDVELLVQQGVELHQVV